MRQNPENPEFPEDFDDFAEESPVVAEASDEERELGDRQTDGYEQLRERRSLGTAVMDEADAAEQVRVVELDEDEYR
ncbi:hypothetical protein [Kitasatospora sp. MAP5-34]|uniref:hypothetical protein n=1 Tax=Kitasatospora sp. MAP5-34 TaxID=3035102 RepID=UPI0024747F64|nr:hypothetical protein [Kitasatospora sp. MAP5-34]MDH6578963.1 hypothetical protein [Kitasatospora sp. MAP5-34]